MNHNINLYILEIPYSKYVDVLDFTHRNVCDLVDDNMFLANTENDSQIPVNINRPLCFGPAFGGNVMYSLVLVTQSIHPNHFPPSLATV